MNGSECPPGRFTRKNPKKMDYGRMVHYKRISVEWFIRDGLEGLRFIFLESGDSLRDGASHKRPGSKSKLCIPKRISTKPTLLQL